MGRTTAPIRPFWPVALREADVGLRPIRYRDSTAWREVRRRNAAWLQPWEATSPQPDDVPGSFAAMVRRLRVEAREARALPFVITVGGRLAGQITVGGIAWGSLRSAYVGYWVDEAVAGRGVAPTALAMATDHCWFNAGLHRIEVNIRPENTASRRVVDKLGFRYEGVRERYLHIDGAWRDHLSYALCADEVPEGLTRRWLSAHPRPPGL